MVNPVVVTGIGVVAPNGLGRQAFWQALITGLSGVRSIRRFDSSRLSSRIAGEVDIDPLQYFDAHELKKVDRSNVLAMAAGLMAIEDSGLNLKVENMENFGSSIGNAVCGIEYAQKESDVIYGKGPRWGSPYLAIAFFPCGSNGLLSIRLGMKGPVLTLCNGNTSATDAIGMAYRLIRSGKAEMMLAGGTEAPLIPMFVGAMARDGWLSRRNEAPELASCPFSRHADGMVLGEGASMLVLENAAHARARGATVYAELAGYGTANSAYDIFRPEPTGYGIERTMHDALREAHISARQVGWVNAQGFSIPAYDRMERRCIRQVFDETRHTPAVRAISAWTGNPIGALGGFQAAASAMALYAQALPMHPSCEQPEDDFAVPLTSTSGKPVSLEAVIQNSFCFMGKNSTLVFKRV